MACEGHGCSDSFDPREASPPYALSSRSGSSEVEGHSGDRSREPYRFWEHMDGDDEGFRAEMEAFWEEELLASGSSASEVWNDWDDSDSAPRRYGMSEAFLALGSKAPEVWDDCRDGAPPSNSIAIPLASAVASLPVDWDWGGSTSDSMSIPPSSAIANVTLADGGRALDCRACCLPLKPPIFQCNRGHAVCGPCLKTHLRWEGPGAAARCNVSGGHGTAGTSPWRKPSRPSV